MYDFRFGKHSVPAAGIRNPAATRRGGSSATAATQLVQPLTYTRFVTFIVNLLSRVKFCFRFNRRFFELFVRAKKIIKKNFFFFFYNNFYFCGGSVIFISFTGISLHKLVIDIETD